MVDLVDIIITGGTLITMDSQRRVISDGALAIAGDRIVEVSKADALQQKYRATKILDASRKVVMPGLIDGHGHAGHGLVKTLGMDQPGKWEEACEIIYTHGSTEEFWYAEALLSSLERLKFGVTTAVSFLGGGGDILFADMPMRSDDPVYGSKHCEAVQEVGVREFLIVGPRRPPFPRKYTRWDGGKSREVLVGFEDQLEVCEALIKHWHHQANGRVSIGLMFPTHHPQNVNLARSSHEELLYQAQSVRQLTKKYDVIFAQEGHTQGTIKFAHEELDILGPDALLSHATELTEEEIDICAETDTRIVHNPSAIASMLGRCPVTELLDAGVTVILGSDGPAPDRSRDMFRHMFQFMRYHRFYFHDPSYLPPGKVLEMVTIDAARALGIEEELGSLEPSKKADVIIVDTFKPHMVPMNMPVHRIAYFANGNDVDTVIVDGQVLMENRLVKTVDESEVMTMAQKATEEALEKSQLYQLLDLPERFWGYAKL